MPKVIRYRQAAIDSKLVPAGSNDFSKLQDLYIIYILDYDPFKKDQLVYSVAKHIKEVPSIIYEDGVHIIYFNTSGHHGGSQAIQNMLSYICNSRSENANDKATAMLDKYVSDIKASDAVRSEYMTWEEFVQREYKMEVEYEVAKAVSETTKEFTAQLAEKDSELADMRARIQELEAQLVSK